MNYEDFVQRRSALRAERSSLVDCAETNVYRSLGTFFPVIAPSMHQEAPYRCHHAERFLAHLGWSAEWKARAQVSHGVRRSLRALFSLLAARGARVGIPSDVYPVYLTLAQEAGVRVQEWKSREGLPALDELDALLVCEPLKPWGTTLSEQEVLRLEHWIDERSERMLLLDSVYATPPTAHAKRLVEHESAVFLTSLSKAWLLPDHVGLCVVPSRWKDAVRGVFASLPKDEQRLRVGYAALTEHRERPAQVQEKLQLFAQQLDAYTQQHSALRAARCVGYFSVSACSFEELLAQGVLGIPASVFGGPEELSLLSSLPPVR